MSDDIVTRLQGSADCVCLFHVEHGLTRKCLYCEAADEIERLRKEVEYLQTPCPRCDYEETDNARQLEMFLSIKPIPKVK